ncbi:hypothetical protein KW818_06810 [Enterobacter quasiroggenkampii]|uniref:hypothetical protein n=1 Tax=Enterobacter quasiroggenkampii TaxID=2497436 RepID=UPI0021CE8F67|nr:hypothetical protein [Enterobacter quasiroggenkampii]MCU6388832.1 hypothetical protein [Enterobacter quasiroggenkampii]
MHKLKDIKKSSIAVAVMLALGSQGVMAAAVKELSTEAAHKFKDEAITSADAGKDGIEMTGNALNPDASLDVSGGSIGVPGVGVSANGTQAGHEITLKGVAITAGNGVYGGKGNIVVDASSISAASTGVDVEGGSADIKNNSSLSGGRYGLSAQGGAKVDVDSSSIEGVEALGAAVFVKGDAVVNLSKSDIKGRFKFVRSGTINLTSGSTAEGGWTGDKGTISLKNKDTRWKVTSASEIAADKLAALSVSDDATLELSDKGVMRTASLDVNKGVLTLGDRTLEADAATLKNATITGKEGKGVTHLKGDTFTLSGTSSMRGIAASLKKLKTADAATVLNAENVSMTLETMEGPGTFNLAGKSDVTSSWSKGSKVSLKDKSRWTVSGTAPASADKLGALSVGGEAQLDLGMDLRSASLAATGGTINLNDKMLTADKATLKNATITSKKGVLSLGGTSSMTDTKATLKTLKTADAATVLNAENVSMTLGNDGRSGYLQSGR